MRLFRTVDKLPEEELKRFQAKLDVIKTVFAACTLASVVGAGAGLWFQWHTLQAAEERERKADERDRKEINRKTRESAQNIINGWDTSTSRTKSQIEGGLRSLKNPRVPSPPAMDKETAIRIWFAEEKDKDEWAIRQNTTSLLNYFESIATAYEKEIGDREMLKESLGGPMMDWRKHLRYYTAIADCVRRHTVWPPYYRIVDPWIQERKIADGSKGRFFDYARLTDLGDACPGSDDRSVRSCCEAQLRKLP